MHPSPSYRRGLHALVAHLRWAQCIAPLLLAACGDELPLPGGGSSDNGDGDGRIHFAVTPPATAEVEMFSRASIPATDPEKNIYTLRIIVFDKNGNRIPDDVFRYYDKTFPADGTVLRGEGITQGTNDIDPDQLGVTIFPVDANEGFSLPVLPYGTGSYIPDADGNVGYAFDDTDATVKLNPTECTVWALANIGRWNNSLVGFQSATSEATDPEATTYTPGQIIDNIQTRDDLRRLYGQRFATDIGENRKFLPMVGTLRAADAHPVVDHTDVITGKATFVDIFGADAAVYPSADYYSAPGTIDLTESRSIGRPYTIYMDQIVAKVRFNISTEATTETDSDGNAVDVHWQFYFDNWTVESLPRYTYIIPHKKDIREYLTNETYTTAAGITGSWNYYLPTSTQEKEHFLHNGSGARAPADASGDTSLDGDWIDTGYTSPSSDFLDPEQESFVYEALEGTNELFYHFYTYGNRCGGRASAPNPANLSGTTDSYEADYATTVTDPMADGKASALYKTLYAPDGASFLVIKGIVRKWVPATGERISKSVVYKIALGGNQTDDYNVYRNTCYTLRITVRGFSQNDLYVTYNADIADGTDNYNSSVRQRYGLSLTANYIDSIDAHYDMRYLQLTIGEPDDTYALKLYDDADVPDAYKTDGNITTIINDGKAPGDPDYVANIPDWIKIAELRSDAVGDNTDMSGNLIRWITDIADGNEIAGITAKEKNEHNFAICTSEYVPADADAGPRVAWLEIEHTYTGKYSDVLESLKNKETTDTYRYLVKEVNNEDGTLHQAIVYIYLKLVQYPPYRVPCTFTITEDDGTTTSTVSKTLLVERFEEYNLHLDPRTASYSADIVDGLPWGWSRYNNTAPFTCYFFNQSTTHDGPVNTAMLYNWGGEETGDNAPSKKAEDDNPALSNNNYTRYSLNYDYAARYCYDKGIDNNRNWYLPAIDELNYLTGNQSDMNSKDEGGDGDIYWSSTTYTTPDHYPQVLKDYWTKYHNRTYGWTSAWLDAWGSRDIYLTFIGELAGRPYSVNYMREVWNYMEANSHSEWETYPYNCAVASCNGLRYLEGYSRKWNADNSRVTNATLLPRLNKYHVRACRVAP